MTKPVGRTCLLTVSPDPGRKRAHLVVVMHKGGGWYEAECMGEAKRCRMGECPHSRGLKWRDSARPIRQVARKP